MIGCSTDQESDSDTDEPHVVSYVVDPANQELQFFWKDKSGQNYGNFQNLKSQLGKDGIDLIFAVNGGMFSEDRSPQGLYIEKGVVLSALDTVSEGFGNFYLQPNGVFFLDGDNKPAICRTVDCTYKESIQYATQSGPLLLIEGDIHPAFNSDSPNLHIRNGVGILPSGKLLFAMSKKKVNFYDFASYFQRHGCRNALYLDGFVSRTYLPLKGWMQEDGDFGVIIGEIKVHE